MKKFFVIALGMIAISSCKKPASINVYDCTGITPTYTANVAAVLNANCTQSGCHNSSSASSGYDLSSYSGAKNASTKSGFLGSIQHISGYHAMPQGRSALPDSTVKMISCWVQNGAPQ